jgi:hypothetical protein
VGEKNRFLVLVSGLYEWNDLSKIPAANNQIFRVLKTFNFDIGIKPDR